MQEESDEEGASNDGSDVDNDSEHEEADREERQENSESSDDEDDDEEDFVVKKALKASSGKQIAVKMGREPSRPKDTKRTGTTTTRTRRGVQSALNALTRKTLEPSETEENSLVAALLNTGKSTTGPRKRGARDTNSMYMEQLRIAECVGDLQTRSQQGTCRAFESHVSFCGRICRE